MRWVRYVRNGEVGFGIVEADRVVPVRGSPFAQYERTHERIALTDLKLLSPVVPPTFYAAGVNYPGHLKTAMAKRGEPFRLPERSDIGYRAVNALIGHADAIVLPPDATHVEYEGELVVVIGREAKHLTESNALGCVFGYTIGNDVSERAWQGADRTLWRAKNTDTFKPMGPWIETEVDLDALTTRVRLNGKQVSSFRTSEMIFGVARTLSAITRYVTLAPGDIVWMGTEDPTLRIAPGDTVDIEIDGIGVLSNPVVAGQ